MADIRGFRGFRYDLGRVGSLSDVVAPPYDVIDPDLQQKLYDQSEYNAIRLELTRDEPGDTETENKYTRAANTLREWLAGNVLRQDTARSLYIYEQEFEVEGKTYTRRGFFARVRLEPFGQGKVFAHEADDVRPEGGPAEAVPRHRVQPVADLPPVPRPRRRGVPRARTVHAQAARRSSRRITSASRNRLWAVTDSHAISTVIGLMGPKPVYIADGHHRYETGLKYLEERKSRRRSAGRRGRPRTSR